MPVATVTERYLQMIFEEPGKEVEDMFAGESDPEAYRKVCDQFSTTMKRLFIVPTKVSLSDIPAYVKLIETETGIRVGVVGVDYLGLMDGPGSNEYEVMSRLAVGVKTTAKMLNLPMVVLSQVNRTGGSGEVEISLNMGRGSGAIEEGADFVLGMWQVGDETKQLVCKILKNRKGGIGSKWLLELNTSTLSIGTGASEYIAPHRKTKLGDI